MRTNYEKQMVDLKDWFKNRLADITDVVLTQAEYSAGADSLKEPHSTLTKQAFDKWLAERNYELSYNQMCNGFFSAARELGKLKIVNQSTLATP